MVHSYRLYCTTWFMIIIVYLQNVNSSYHILNYVYIYLHLNPILFINNFHKSLFRTHHGGAFLWSCSFFFVLYFIFFYVQVQHCDGDEWWGDKNAPWWCLSFSFFGESMVAFSDLVPFFLFLFLFLYFLYIYIYIFMFKFIL